MPRAAITALLPTLRELRHDLHRHPEIGFDLPRTAGIVADRLKRLGLDVREGVGRSGIVAMIDSPNAGPVIALRADMDALPIVEATGAAYASETAGTMHACGHDGHTTMLLGAAQALAQERDKLPGPVKLIFQPAEENVEGAAAMIADGAMDNPRPEAVFGLHGWPGLPVGTIGLREGPMMASSDRFDARIVGKGGHAAHPDGGLDPIAIAAHVITAWQTAVTRKLPASSPTVVTVTRVEAGSAYNIVPPHADLCGTWRALTPELRERVPAILREVGEGICSGFGASFELSLIRGTAVTMNDPKLARFVGSVAEEAFGAERVSWVDAPSMGAEDFGQFAAVVPGCFFWLGLGERPFCHSPNFDFADDAMPAGVEMFVRIARGYSRERR